jgi:hypothetical protein
VEYWSTTTYVPVEGAADGADGLVKLKRPPAAGAAGAAAGVDVASVGVLAAGAAPNEKPEGAAFGAELASVVVDVSAGFPKRGVADVALDFLQLATGPFLIDRRLTPEHQTR